MKMTKWIVGLSLAAALGLTGCGKSEKPPPGAVAAADLSKLQAAFPAASPEIQSSMAKIAFGFRYRDYPAALAELQKLANIPSLTEAQKKAVSDFTEQLKKLAAEAAPKPAQ